MEKQSSAKVKRLADDTYLVGSAEDVLVQFASGLPDNSTTDVGKPRDFTLNGFTASIVDWGNKNDLPNYREQLVINNSISPSLIKRKRDLVLGQSWFAYRHNFEGGKRTMDEVPMPADAEAFFLNNQKLFEDVAGELMKHELAIVEYVRANDGTIAERTVMETKYMRANRADAAGRVNTWWWSNAWYSDMAKQLKQNERKLRDIPVLDRTRMMPQDPRRQKRFGVVLGDWLFNDGYYPIPAYWGTKHWIDLANIIPVFHLANLKNMSAPRFVVVIPHDYFMDYIAYEQAEQTNNEEAKAEVLATARQKKQAFLDDFNKLVTGVGNNGRTLTIESIKDEVFGKIVDKRITIEPLVIDLRDEALLKLYEASNVATISGMGIHPTLANIESQGRLSSGTEIRNAYLLWLIIAAPAYRNKLYQLVELEKKIHGWPSDIHYAIRDEELTTLAENPSGVRPAETTVGK